MFAAIRERVGSEIVERERDYSQALRREGEWRHRWRIVGEYSNYSILDVDSHDEGTSRCQGCRGSPTWTSR